MPNEVHSNAALPTALPLYLDLWQQTIGWQPSEAQQSLFQQLYDHIVAGNKRLNLTRITTPEEFWEKHLWDSISGIAPWLSRADESKEAEANEREADPLRIIDIGTGGGIPGIPAAIALSSIAKVRLTLLDSTRKKIQFLQEICPQLNLKSVCIAERAEALAQLGKHREAYDLALVRAVGPAATCAEYAIPFLTLGAQAVLFRGQWSAEDTEALAPVVELLGGEITDVQVWKTPLSQSDRHCIFIYKNSPTPDEFPRAVGTPAKKPLT